MRDDERYGWCSACGREPVYPARGEDTCASCIRSI